MSDANQRARAFLAEASQFQLGILPTESRHPRTTQLSELAATNLEKAVELINSIDQESVQVVIDQLPAIEKMRADIAATLDTGGRIFLCGCGATGRLSISLETLWREEAFRLGKTDLRDRVSSFIAGGDFALVRSIENFEDHPEYGSQQLHDLGFTKNDLLISCTEGGETPFVIGATEEAERMGARSPYFLYCNPTELLRANVERSRRVIDNPRIHKICLETGPMAISGSTRLQATTAQMLAVGSALFSVLQGEHPARFYVSHFMKTLQTANMSRLKTLIEKEADIYAREEYCVHRTAEYGITVLTDTTERTPTFSLHPFESPTDEVVKPAWTYLCIPDVQNSIEAWQRVLGRSPRPVEWQGFSEKFGMKKTLSYDFSPRSLERRRRSLGTQYVHVFDIKARGSQMIFALDNIEAQIERPDQLLSEHLLLKCALNISSTLVMGRLGRFKGNLMLYVRPTNKKLIDRSVRFVRILLEDVGVHASYEDVCHCLIETFDELTPDEPVVLRTFEKLHKKKLRRQGISVNK